MLTRGAKTPARGAKKDPARIDQLTLDPDNRRKRTPRSRDMIVASLRNNGAARSIVLDEKNVVLAGNGVVDAAPEAGIEKLRIIDAAGDEIIAVRRHGLTEAQKRELAMFDNRTAELSEWDLEQLAADVRAGHDLTRFFTDEELAALLGAAPSRGGLTDPDDVPEPRRTSIVAGDLFELGGHRLLCGDSTKPDDVAKVLAGDRPGIMVTDPPYGVNYDPTWRQKVGVSSSARTGKVRNDARADWTETYRLFPGDVAYVWHGGIFSSVVDGGLGRAGFQLRAQIIWVKPRIILSRGHYHWQHEMCFYAVREGRTGHWAGSRKESTTWMVVPTVHRCLSCGSAELESAPAEFPTTTWDIPLKDSTGETTHGTQKPVECMARPMRHHNILQVYEPFSGSGSSLIAGEQTNREVRAIELDPVYVQQALDRWERFTGKKATKVGARVAAPKERKGKR